MKINLAKSAGFCFGVKRAIEIAVDSAKREKNIYMLGDIVHNEKVIERIRRLGIKKTVSLKNGRGKTLLVRAHGIDKKTYCLAKERGFKIIDATCPMVKEIHRIVLEREKKNQPIIIIGDKDHDEVRGIAGQLKTKAVVIDPAQKIPLKKIKRLKSVSVVVQSTQNMDNVKAILKILKKHIRHLRFFNTICRPTQMKQSEVHRMPLENEVMVIIGSRSSANSKRLYEISKSLNRNSYWVNSASQLRKGWFSGVKNVAVTAGASTPESTTEQIIKQIKNYRAAI